MPPSPMIEQHHALQAEEEGQRDDERRDAEPGDEQADEDADHRAGQQPDEDRRAARASRAVVRSTPMTAAPCRR